MVESDNFPPDLGDGTFSFLRSGTTVDHSLTMVDIDPEDMKDPSKSHWTIAPITCNPKPTALGLHTSVVINDKLYAFGGCSFMAESLNQIRMYDPATNEWDVDLKVDGDIRPPWREDHTAVAINGKMYIYGGTDTERCERDEDDDIVSTRMWEFDPSVKKWLELEVHVEGVSRSNHACAALGTKMYLFGGTSSRSHFIESFDVDEQTWFEEHPRGIMPPRLLEHSTCVQIDGRFYLFGGEDRKADSYTNRLYIFDPEEDRSRVVIPPEGEVWPPVRMQHVAFVYNGKMFIHGGVGDVNFNRWTLNDMYMFDPITGKWTDVTMPNCPTLMNHTGVVIGDKIYLFGGRGEIGCVMNDLWIMDVPETWKYKATSKTDAKCKDGDGDINMELVG